MKKKYIFGILFFSGLWGLSEALLGNWLYEIKAPYESIPLTIIAFAILTAAVFYLPRTGTATIIALCAMLYKFFNQPDFVCHFLGIAMIGICYDIFFNVLPIKRKMLSAFGAALANYLAFGLMMTYITNNGFWNSAKLFSHIGEGFIAAIGCAIIVPVVIYIAWAFKNQDEEKFAIRWNGTQILASMITGFIWTFGIASFVIQKTF